MEEQTIQFYKITREIGKGGMGIIYKALDPRTQQSVAIKVLPPTLVDRTAVERFTREAQAMKRLKHKNMVNVFDFGQERGKHFLVMEFVDGETLKNIIKHQGKLPINAVLDIVLQVAGALAYTHGEGMIHRDIKPGNIMITRDAKVKVMDFGLVKIPGITNLTMEGSAVGTAEYMSPEQMSDEGVDLRTDIYSLGVTMYEMLAGHPPFQGENIQAILMKHKHEEPKPLSEIRGDIPPQVDQIVKKAMAKELNLRYQDAREIIDDINRYRGDRAATPPASAAEESAPTPITGLQKEDRIPSEKKFSVVPIVWLLILAGLGYFGYKNRDHILKIVSGVKKKIPAAGAFMQDEAQRYLHRLEEAEKHHGEGQRYYYEGNISEAIKEYEKAIELRNDHPIFYSDLALVYEEEKNTEKAVQTWQELLKYDHISPLAEQAREHLKKLREQ